MPSPRGPSETAVLLIDGMLTRRRPSFAELVRVHSGTVSAGSSPVPRSRTTRSYPSCTPYRTASTASVSWFVPPLASARETNGSPDALSARPACAATPTVLSSAPLAATSVRGSSPAAEPAAATELSTDSGLEQAASARTKSSQIGARRARIASFDPCGMNTTRIIGRRCCAPFNRMFRSCYNELALPRLLIKTLPVPGRSPTPVEKEVDRDHARRRPARAAPGARGSAAHTARPVPARRGGTAPLLQGGEPATDRRVQAARRIQQGLLPLPRGAPPRGGRPLQRQPRPGRRLRSPRYWRTCRDRDAARSAAGQAGCHGGLRGRDPVRGR